jgi:hypothetical protein
MILSLKTRNILGFNYNLSLRNGREQNKVTVKGHNLFSTYQITGDIGIKAESYKKIVAAFHILKVLNTPAFTVFCREIDGVASIEIEFIRIDSNQHEYTTSSYYIEMGKEGIIKEVIDGTPTESQLRTDPYKPFIPAAFLDYFELQLFCYDLNDPICYEDLISVFKATISSTTFAKFVINFLELLEQPNKVTPINIYKDHTGEVKVKYPDKATAEGDPVVNFSDQDESFKTMCAVAWPIFSLTLRTGLIVLHNIDKLLDYKTVYNIVDMFNHIEALDSNPAQLVFSAMGADYGMYPEQTMVVGEQKGITYCTWQNY